METQLRYFKKVERSMRKKLGDSIAYDLFSNSVYFFHVGGNDYKIPFEDSSVHEKYNETEHVYTVIGNLTAVVEVSANLNALVQISNNSHFLISSNCVKFLIRWTEL